MKKMLELDFSIKNLKEQIEYDKFVSLCTNVIEDICKERNIDLWEGIY